MDLRSLTGWGLPAGAPAPDFSLMGADTKFYSLSQFKGKKVFLYFFPKAHTSGCTAQACSFRTDYKLLRDQGYTLLGVSTDALSVVQAFKDQHDLPFPVLSDVSQRVCRDYEVLLPLGVANRVTFLINGQGTIEQTFHFLPWKSYAQTLMKRAGVSATT